MVGTVSPRYRWVVLVVSALVNITIQLQWIALSPISATAAEFYGVTTTEIGYFSIMFMVVFIPLSIPAAWLIDRRGIRFAIGLGAVAVAVGGVLRWLAGDSYPLALAATFLSAAAQPLMLNSWTTVAGKWWPRDRRATVVSVLTLAMMVGVALGTLLSPALLEAGLALNQVLGVYGAAAAVTAVAWCLLGRDADHRIDDAQATRALELAGLRHALAQRPFQVFLLALFVALGVFNGLSTWALQVAHAISLPDVAAEVLLEALLVGGVIGALVLGAASDRTGRRVPWTAVPMIAAAPLMFGFVVPGSLWGLGVCAFLAGFLLTGAMPVGMQYACEIAAPTPEGASSGLFQLCGQASFVVVLFMDAARGSEGGFLIGFAVLAVLLAGIGIWLLRQPEPSLAVAIPGDLPG